MRNRTEVKGLRTEKDRTEVKGLRTEYKTEELSPQSSALSPILRGKKIERFEDLIAWQKARELSKLIYQVTRQGAFSKDFGLSGQIQRATVSIMSNIAEGFERGGRGEFHQFLSMAKASCAEVRSQMYVALDAAYVDHNTFTKILMLAEEVGRITGGLRASVEKQRNENKGLRLKD